MQRVPDARRLARLQLEAQLQYRLGNNKQAIKVYSELFQTHKVPSVTPSCNCSLSLLPSERCSPASVAT